MNVERYLARRQDQIAMTPEVRCNCWRCFQPRSNCYCDYLKPFDSKIEFVILIHPIESRRRIATGRMSHLNLLNSKLIEGEDFSTNQTLTTLLEDPARNVVILYPGTNSSDLRNLPNDKQKKFSSGSQVLTVVVIDGTWATARKMIRSQNLKNLARVSFQPSRASRFRVRKQPEKHCYATIEAIFETIEALGPLRGFDLRPGQHHALLDVFDRMVERQIQFLPDERRRQLL